jgi:hypothetical protein
VPSPIGLDAMLFASPWCHWAYTLAKPHHTKSCCPLLPAGTHTLHRTLTHKDVTTKWTVSDPDSSTRSSVHSCISPIRSMLKWSVRAPDRGSTFPHL